ncbi:MAG: hypothetical protein Alpg2KO_31240 [Alphaproteobacteria bacterium]
MSDEFKLENIQEGAFVSGHSPQGMAEAVNVTRVGNQGSKVTLRTNWKNIRHSMFSWVTGTGCPSNEGAELGNLKEKTLLSIAIESCS